MVAKKNQVLLLFATANNKTVFLHRLHKLQKGWPHTLLCRGISFFWLCYDRFPRQAQFLLLWLLRKASESHRDVHISANFPAYYNCRHTWAKIIVFFGCAALSRQTGCLGSLSLVGIRKFGREDVSCGRWTKKCHTSSTQKSTENCVLHCAFFCFAFGV